MDRRMRIGCVVVAGLACFTSESRSHPVIEDFYCETSREAFIPGGYYYRGSYVDAEGRVFEFRASQPRLMLTDEWNSLTKALIEEKYNRNRRRTGTIDVEKLNEVRGWLAEARNGSPSRDAAPGAESGVSLNACWIRDAGTVHFVKVELEAIEHDARGAWMYKSLSPAGAELVRWLASIAK